MSTIAKIRHKSFTEVDIRHRTAPLCIKHCLIIYKTTITWWCTSNNNSNNNRHHGPFLQWRWSGFIWITTLKSKFTFDSSFYCRTPSHHSGTSQLTRTLWRTVPAHFVAPYPPHFGAPHPHILTHQTRTFRHPVPRGTVVKRGSVTKRCLVAKQNTVCKTRVQLRYGIQLWSRGKIIIIIIIINYVFI